MNAAIEQINQAVALVVPEIILLATVCVMFLAGPFLVTDAGRAGAGLRHRWGTLALLALGMAWVCWFRSTPEEAGSGPFRADDLLWYTRGLSLTVGVILTLILWNQIEDGRAAEAHACLLTIVAGANLTAAANDLVALFLALEMVSIPTYVLLYLPQRDRRMREATVKYFLLSIFSSALLLYGMSWLYGAAGTTNLTGIADAAAAGKVSLNSGLARVSAALLLAGLGFRITIVPFHFYAPDVFQGVLSSAAAMLSVVPKLVGFVALFRLLPLADGVDSLHDWSPSGPLRLWLALLAVLTMFVGNLMALRQSHLHRMLAYSSMAHTGYMLGGFTVGSEGSMGGASALLFYLVTYGLITIGVFALLSAVGQGPRSAQTDADVSGLSRTRPAAALGLAVCLISLTGLPPTAGFLGKLNLIIAAWSEGTWVGHGLAIAQGINAPITAWYYLRVVAVMYLQPAEREGEPGQEPAASLAGACCTAATLALFVVPQWLWDAASRAAG